MKKEEILKLHTLTEQELVEWIRSYRQILHGKPNNSHCRDTSRPACKGGEIMGSPEAEMNRYDSEPEPSYEENRGSLSAMQSEERWLKERLKVIGDRIDCCKAIMRLQKGK